MDKKAPLYLSDQGGHGPTWGEGLQRSSVTSSGIASIKVGTLTGRREPTAHKPRSRKWSSLLMVQAWSGRRSITGAHARTTISPYLEGRYPSQPSKWMPMHLFARACRFEMCPTSIHTTLYTAAGTRQVGVRWHWQASFMIFESSAWIYSSGVRTPRRFP